MEVGGLARLERPLMVIYICCLFGCCMIGQLCAFSGSLKADGFLSIRLEAKSSCSGVGLGGRISRVFTSSLNQRIARNVAQGYGLESVSVRERQ